MTSGPLLVPNLGAEEHAEEDAKKGEKSVPPGRAPRVVAAAALWRWLFPASAILAGQAVAEAASWPESLAAQNDRAAFDWLDDATPCVAWLGTQAAGRVASNAGRELWGPDPAVVSHVHDKAFAVRAAEDLDLIPRPLRGTTRIFEPEDLEAQEPVVEAVRERVASWPEWTQGRFTLKPRLGTSGRGRVDGSRATLADSSKLRSALPRLARQGGAILEPWLDRACDLSAQFHIDPDGPVTLLGSLELLTQVSGGYRGHRGQIDSRGRVFSGHDLDETLRGAAAQLANAARDAGFFGAAGLDALCFRREDDPTAPATLRPVVELNARFTMGTVVLGLIRRLLPRVRSELELSPGDRGAFRFELDAPNGGWQSAQRAAGPGSLLVPLCEDGAAVQPAILFSRISPQSAERNGEPA